MAAFNWVDLTILGLLLFSVLVSLVRGFVREAISLATWILAIWVAYKFGHDFGQNVLTMIEAEQIRFIAGIGILFFGILIVGAVLNYTVSQLVSFTGLSVIDRILGMAFGFARGVLLIAVLMLIGEIVQTDKDTWWSESQLLPQFSPWSEWLKGFVPEQVEKMKRKEQLGQVPVSAPGEPSVPAPLSEMPVAAPAAPS